MKSDARNLKAGDVLTARRTCTCTVTSIEQQEGRQPARGADRLPQPAGRAAGCCVVDGSALSLHQPHPPGALEVAAEVLRRKPGLWKVVLSDEVAHELPDE
jgi:hypothetical protein